MLCVVALTPTPTVYREGISSVLGILCGAQNVRFTYEVTEQFPGTDEETSRLRKTKVRLPLEHVGTRELSCPANQSYVLEPCSELFSVTG